MDDIHITAKWANRMLRPLTSLHHRLGKYREIQSINAQEPGTEKAASSLSISQASKRNAVVSDFEHDSECGDNDPSWIPRKLDAKRVKHKYVAKGERLRTQPRSRLVLRSPETVKTLPGAIEIATPLITGKSGDVTSRSNKKADYDYQQYGNNSHHAASSSEHERWTEKTVKRQKQARFPQPDPQWRVSLDSAKDTNYVDIVQRLDVLFLKFLEKTRLADSRSPRSTSDSRSLLLTVMRRLPQFIAEEQRVQDEIDDDNDIDMVDAYFTELESAYGSSGKGWQPLREAVRSQGIFLVCDMLQKNWITHLTASTLVNKCIDAGENDAVEKLLGVLLSRLDHYDFPGAFDPWKLHQSIRDPVRLLHKYWTVSENGSFTFKEIERLLLRQILPTEWMVTIPWKACVVSATKSLSSGDDEYAAATNLIIAILETAADTHNESKKRGSGDSRHLSTARRHDVRGLSIDNPKSNQGPCPIYVHDALSNLVSSLIVALCSMYCVRMEKLTGLDLCSSARIINVFNRLAFTLQCELPLSPGTIHHHEPKQVYLLRRGYILLGHYILKCWQDTLPLDCADVGVVDVVLRADCDPFFALLEQNHDIIKDLSGLVGQIVRCCERDGEQAQCRRARKLCTNLLAFEDFGLNNLTLFLSRVAVEVALDFAQYSQDVEDHAFATDIQERVSALRIRLKSHHNTKYKAEDFEMLSFRWEEGIGEWIAKTPLVRTKGVMSRVLSRTMEEIPKAMSFSSISEGSRSPSIDSGSSITSTSTPGSATLKRRYMGRGSLCQDVERPRRMHKKRRLERIRQSERTHDNVLVVIRAEEKLQNSSSNYETDSDNDPLETVYDSEEWPEPNVKFPTETEETSNHETDANAVVELQSRVAMADFEVIIQDCVSASSNLPLKRGRGRPRKHVAQPAPSHAVATTLQARQGPSQQRLVIPDSEDESDDELSFL